MKIGAMHEDDPVSRRLMHCILAQPIPAPEQAPGFGDVVPQEVPPMPVGYIAAWVNYPGWPWIACQGQKLSCKNYPALYAAIGDRFCPPVLLVPLPRTRWESLVARFRESIGLDPLPVRTRELPNPSYVPGMFGLPDLRSEWEKTRYDF